MVDNENIILENLAEFKKMQNEMGYLDKISIHILEAGVVQKRYKYLF